MSPSDRRKRRSNVLLVIGVVAIFLGHSSISILGLAILLSAPIPFTVAAVLVPSRWRVAVTVIVWGLWAFLAYETIELFEILG